MKIRKTLLRDCASVALEQRGFRVERKGGAGIIPGARLLAFKDDVEHEVAVRTSLDREVGLTRHPNGEWMTIPKMDQVLIAVPSKDDPGSAEVFNFDPDVIISVFNEALAFYNERHPALASKAPIFVSLDDQRRGQSDEFIPGLKAKAKWWDVIPLGSRPKAYGSLPASSEEFYNRVKREFADAHNFDVEEVVVEFRIIKGRAT